MIAERARRFGHRHVHYEPDLDALPAHLAALAAPGDVVLMMGAGDIWRRSRAFAALLPDDEPAAA